MSSHDASSSAVGYMYQIRWALLNLLESADTRPDMSLTLETFDDVSWHTAAGSPMELIQLKHHSAKNGSLTDKSSDIWRTLKVWMDDPVFSAPGGPQLVIFTNSTAPDKSAASLLKEVGRDEAQASAKLSQAASTSEDRSTQPARDQWRKLDESTRLDILTRTRVIDSGPSIGDLTDRLERAIWIIAPQGRTTDFLDVIDSWWTKVSIDLLTKSRKTIRVEELKLKLDDIRDQFRSDNLITTVPGVDGEDVLGMYGNHAFVHQLNWVGATRTALKFAVADFHRAVAQTTDWVDRNLIEMSEFDAFKQNLIDEWEITFDDMIQDMGDHASDADKKRAGLELYRKLRDSTAVQVRPRYTEAFYARGIRHEISDEGKRGWHPDFEQLVKSLTVGSL